MKLYIPTRGRVNMQLTLQNMPEVWRKQTCIVCPADEVKQHVKNWPTSEVTQQPDPKMSIAQKRKWIFELAARRKQDKIMMLDDDLSFCPRHKYVKQFAGFQKGTAKDWRAYREKDPEASGLYKCSDPEDPKIDLAFTRIDKMLDTYRHGGFGPRLMNQEMWGEFMLNRRSMYANAYHVPTVMAHCKLGRIEHREDFDYTLQLMKKGFENAIYCWVVVEQYEGYNAEGGASLERSIKASNADALKLARLHPGLVKTKQKDYLISVPRVEVVIRWQNAIQLGKTGLIG
jgi:TET-associated glycosyltransferase-like protein